MEASLKLKDLVAVNELKLRYYDRVISGIWNLGYRNEKIAMYPYCGI